MVFVKGFVQSGLQLQEQEHHDVPPDAKQPIGWQVGNTLTAREARVENQMNLEEKVVRTTTSEPPLSW